MLHVLWLCSQYPNNLNVSEADFIQRSAQATSLHHKVHVIKVTPDPDAKNVSKLTRTYQQWPTLTETYINYPKPTSFIGKTISYFRWYSIYKYAIETFIEKNGKPDLVHVHVSEKSGAMASLLKRKYKIPYVVSEYEDNSLKENENLSTQQQWTDMGLVKHTLKNSLGAMVTNNFLAKKIVAIAPKITVNVCPLPVNSQHFYYRPTNALGDGFKVLCITGINDKQVSEVLGALSELDATLFNCAMTNVPPSKILGYKTAFPSVSFLQQIPYENVAMHLQDTDVLILIIDKEKTPLYLHEALCCGIPVIILHTGKFHDPICKEQGVVRCLSNINELPQTIYNIKEAKYDRELMSAQAISQFGYEKVSNTIDHWYQNIVREPV